MNYCSECSHRGVCGTLNDLCKEKNIIFAGEKVLFMHETEACDRFEPDKETALRPDTKIISNDDNFYCPKCGHWLGSVPYELCEYCPHCGQHIDWKH